MSKFDLGLEALAEHDAFGTDDILSYEYLDTVIQFNAGADESVVISDGISSMCAAYENLSAICDVIHQYGNTPALEALVGDNFAEGFSFEAAKNAQDGLWAKFVKWLKTLWAKIKAWFAKFLTSSKAMRTKLRARVQEIKNAGEIEPIQIKLPEKSVMDRNNAEIQKVLLGALNKVNAHLEDPEKIKTDDLKNEFADGDDRTPFERLIGAAAEGVTEVGFDKAVALLEALEKRLMILEDAKAAVDKAADKLEKSSFDLHYGQKLTKKEEPDDAARRSANATIKHDNEELDKSGKMTDEYRSNVMKFHSQVSKWLSKTTKETIAGASHALSAIKPKKK